MKIEKVDRRIEIELRYGDPLQPEVKKRGYKWDPTKKVWWKGFTQAEMDWANSKASERKEAASEHQARREAGVPLKRYTYEQTQPVAAILKEIGCWLDSTGERVWSAQQGKHVFAKCWYAPKDKENEAIDIIRYGSREAAERAKGNQEAEARQLAEQNRLKAERKSRYEHYFRSTLGDDIMVKHYMEVSEKTDYAIARLFIRGHFDFVAVLVHDYTTDSILHASYSDAYFQGQQRSLAEISGDNRRIDGLIKDFEGQKKAQWQADAAAKAQEEASAFGRQAVAGKQALFWQGKRDLKTGDVLHTKNHGWVLILSAATEYYSASKIESDDDMDVRSPRDTAGYVTRAEVIPVAPTQKEIIDQGEKDAAKKIKSEAAAQAAMAQDDTRFSDTPEYRLAHERLARLEAGESAVQIISPSAPPRCRAEQNSCDSASESRSL